jgi:glycerol-3-phosphate dehydrogenase
MADIFSQLQKPFDIAIIGAGIHGAVLAYEAARAGYRVALFEKADFGGSTSANSLKIIHGGIRYLQHLNIKRMRESILSRRAMMQFAPHLVQPLPCLMPTYGHGIKGREMMRLAFFIYDLIAFDRNAGLPHRAHLPAGGALSLQQCLEELPEIDRDGLNGAALWYDAMAINTERLLQEYLNEAARYGACICNYKEVVDLAGAGDRITGITVRDCLKNAEFEVHARTTVNTSGPWVDSLIGSAPKLSPVTSGRWAKAINIVVKKKLFEHYAVGLEGRGEFIDKDAFIKRGKRLFFFVPWRRDYTMIGTSYRAAAKGSQLVEKNDIVEMLDDVNKIHPGAGLKWEDITFIHAGLLPQQAESNTQPGQDDVQLEKSTRIIDHSKTDGVHGIISISGVKYTTAPDIARKMLHLLKQQGSVPRQEGRYSVSSRTGPPRDHTKLISALGRDYETVRQHLKSLYGPHWRNIFDFFDTDQVLTGAKGFWLSDDPPLLEAEVIYFIKREQAVKLSDVVLRRSALGSAQCPPAEVLKSVAACMSKQLGWTEDICKSEIEAVYNAYLPLEPAIQ